MVGVIGPVGITDLLAILGSLGCTDLALRKILETIVVIIVWIFLRSLYALNFIQPRNNLTLFTPAMDVKLCCC